MDICLLCFVDCADMTDIIVSIICDIIVVQLLLYFEIIVDDSLLFLNYVIAILRILLNDGCVVQSPKKQQPPLGIEPKTFGLQD